MGILFQHTTVYLSIYVSDHLTKVCYQRTCFKFVPKSIKLLNSLKGVAFFPNNLFPFFSKQRSKRHKERIDIGMFKKRRSRRRRELPFKWGI